MYYKVSSLLPVHFFMPRLTLPTVTHLAFSSTPSTASEFKAAIRGIIGRGVDVELGELDERCQAEFCTRNA